MRVRLDEVVVIVLSLVLFLATDVSQAQKTELPPVQQDSAFPVATAESQGMSQESLDAVADSVRGYFEQDLIVGAELLVIKNRRTVLHESFGWRERDNKVPMGRHTIFNIRSMTKPITGAAIQILIDRGELKLDDRASKYIAGFDNDKSREITIEQLLSHRSGLPLTAFKVGPRQYTDLQAVANSAGKSGPQFPADSKFWYSDAGTDVLGAIVEKISGRPLDEFWQEHLLDPLGMKDSFCAIDKVDRKTEARWSRLSTLYRLIGRSGNQKWGHFGNQKPSHCIHSRGGRRHCIARLMTTLSFSRCG